MQFIIEVIPSQRKVSLMSSMSLIYKIHILFLIATIGANGTKAQIVKLPSYLLETGGIVSTGRQSPFWLVSNQFGRQSTKSASGFLSARFETSGDTSKGFDYNYGLEIVDRFDGDNTFWIHQAYFKARLHFLYLRAGKCEESYGIQDSMLSSGSALWSDNSRPMPKIVLGSNGFVNVPFTKGYVQLNGMLSHGWFGNDGYVKNVYLHHKYLYIKLGGKLPVNISWGLHHYAMWGGTDPVLGSLPDGWDAYRRVFFNHRGNAENPNTPVNDTLNRLGNHLGSRNYAIDIKLKPVSVSLYYQTIFEDNSGYKRHFMPDGLWGIALNSHMDSKIVYKLLYEYFNSDYQSGGIKYEDDGTTVVDDYFNNYLYQSGWTYHGYTIGSPLITSPVLHNKKRTGIANNRVKAHHIGIAGKVKIINYKILATWSRNFGTYGNPFPETRYSKSVFLQFSNDYERTKGFETVLQLGFDIGDMYGNNMGIGIIVRKHGIF